MKRLLFVIAIALFVTTANAQDKGDMAVGAQVAFGTGDGFSNIGIGAKFQWNPANRLRLEPSFTYFLKKDLVSMWDISANVHYQFPLGKVVGFYPLAGVGVMGVKVDIPEVDLGEYGSYGGSASDTKFGVNVGVGADFNLSEKFVVNAEVKYTIVQHWNRLIISAGFAYKF